ncbi:unnamed protein product [Acanthoscelides obtectus]|uniref:Tyr recombinase domain-containing protein n=1 Tax=Acanthoscelides obtectus TaxID=200917 RepID=A0A9P0MHA5_ACAOB|nr:unnamed protein product [Acanthoscelides obtectus]CAK1681107.1 hypothetical protein AOBTE_LOCUS33020 [Acanthoscelides obtectus]
MEKSYPGGRNFVRNSFLHRGFPAVGLDTVMESLAPSTLHQYNSYYQKWWSFCIKSEKNPYSYSLNLLISFLTEEYKKGASYATLNSQYASLLLLFNIDAIDKAHLNRFLKGVSKKNPPKPKYQTTWDPTCVLGFLSSWYPLEELPISQLTQKMVTLLALVTGHRIQTLSKMKISNIIYFEDKLEIRIPDSIKTSSCKNFQPALVISYFREEPKLCLASVIDVYIKKTKDTRPNDTDYLVLTYKKPIHPASSQRISNWIKLTLKSSGIDMSQFSAYSTRHAATSAAYRAGVSIEQIRKTVGWTKNSSMFNRFYNRPLGLDSTEFAKAILTLK